MTRKEILDAAAQIVTQGREEHRRLKRLSDRILNDTRKEKNDECDN